jgi:Ca2+-binding RTX toxin-like protein
MTRNRTTRLRLESLEDRALMAASITLNDGLLTVTGTGQADVIRISMVRNSPGRILPARVTVADTAGVPRQDASGAVLDRFIALSDIDAITVDAKSGNDRVEINIARPSTLLGGYGHDTVSGGSAADSIDGGWDNDTLYGRGGDDVLDGGYGNDNLYGGGGDDSVQGNYGNDGVFGGSGWDTVQGGSGADRILKWASWVSATENFPGDAIITFQDTFSTSSHNTSGLTVPLRYTAQAWTEGEIEIVDGALAWLHELTGNTALLKTSTGGGLSFRREGAYVPYDVTDGVNDAAQQQANAFGVNVAGWNLGGGSISYTDHGFALGDLVVHEVAIHEIGHNWDTESDYWEEWQDLSGWEQEAVAGPGETLSGDGNWTHDSSADFYRPYSQRNPLEDWATTWEAYYYRSQGLLTAADVADIQDKLDLLDEFFASLA